MAQATRAALDAWQALATAAHKAGRAILGAAVACSHAEALAAYRSGVTDDAIAAGADAAAVAGLPGQALAATGREARPTRRCAARPVDYTSAIAADARSRTNDTATFSGSTFAARVLCCARHAEASTANETLAAGVSTSLALREAEAIAALGCRLAEDAGAPWSGATLVLFTAHETLASAMNHSLAALRCAPLTLWQADAAAALGLGATDNPNALRIDAATVLRISWQALTTTGEKPRQTRIRATGSIDDTDPTATMGLVPADYRTAVRALTALAVWSTTQAIAPAAHKACRAGLCATSASSHADSSAARAVRGAYDSATCGPLAAEVALAAAEANIAAQHGAAWTGRD